MRKASRARLAVLRAVLITAVGVFGINACGTFGPTTGEQTVVAPPRQAEPAGRLIPLQTVPTTTTVPEPLTVPIDIPFDSYASEPVVEFGWIEIPKIDLLHRAYQGVTLHNIDRGPSHWPGSALPGKRGNAVFAGHRVTHSHPFLRVHELVAGDEVVFRVDGVRSVYRVTESFVVSPDDTWIANQTDASTATLYACHPPGSDAQRYVVKMALASTGPDAPPVN